MYASLGEASILGASTKNGVEWLETSIIPGLVLYSIFISSDHEYVSSPLTGSDGVATRYAVAVSQSGCSSRATQALRVLQTRLD